MGAKKGRRTSAGRGSQRQGAASRKLSDTKQDDVEPSKKTTESVGGFKAKKKSVTETRNVDANRNFKSESPDEVEQERDSEAEGDSSNNDDEVERQTTKGKFFSDENAKWLVPKDKLLSSSEDEGEEGDEMLNSEESDEEMEVEKESRMLDARRHEEEEEAEHEMRETVEKNTSVYHLPTKEELEKDVDRVVPPSELKSHIDSILGVLAEFKDRREAGRTRSEYVDRLGDFIAEMYGYLPELVEYFLTMFSPAETLEFVDYSDKQRPLVIRTNTLKARRKDVALALMKRGVAVDPLASWSKVGLKVLQSPVPIGATPEYLSGHYMLQSAASMCPVMALSPEPKERVLDMSAAPGGKTSYIAQLMRNTGVVFANDLKPDRQKATVANLHRLGVKNAVACAHDGRKLPKLFRHYRFDRVLLDAPCSGLGVISRDPSCKVQRTLADINKTAHLQKELLLAAIDVLNHKSKSGGVMVYSTCSVSVAENEEVVNYALQKRDIKIVETGLDFGKPGFTRYQQKRFHPSIALTRRFYPHVHNMDGFFVCKIQKLSDNIPGAVKETTDSQQDGGDDGEDNVEGTKGSPKAPRNRNMQESSNEAKKGKKKRSRSEKISVPPKQPKRNKTANAKTAKPRRMKIDKEGL